MTISVLRAVQEVEAELGFVAELMPISWWNMTTPSREEKWKFWSDLISIELTAKPERPKKPAGPGKPEKPVILENS